MKLRTLVSVIIAASSFIHSTGVLASGVGAKIIGSDHPYLTSKVHRMIEMSPGQYLAYTEVPMANSGTSFHFRLVSNTISEGTYSHRLILGSFKGCDARPLDVQIDSQVVRLAVHTSEVKGYGNVCIAYPFDRVDDDYLQYRVQSGTVKIDGINFDTSLLKSYDDISKPSYTLESSELPKIATTSPDISGPSTEHKSAPTVGGMTINNGVIMVGKKSLPLSSDSGRGSLSISAYKHVLTGDKKRILMLAEEYIQSDDGTVTHNVFTMRDALECAELPKIFMINDQPVKFESNITQLPNDPAPRCISVPASEAGKEFLIEKMATGTVMIDGVEMDTKLSKPESVPESVNGKTVL